MTRQDVPVQLLADVENYCNVTWQDDATDEFYRNMIAQVAAYLDSKWRQPADYTEDGLPRALLFDGVRYMRDSAFDVFENNYQSLILAAQYERLVSGNGVESSLSAQD